MASQPAALPFLSSKQEHRKIHFFIYILRPDETNPTQGSKAIDKDGLYRQGLVSWPKFDSQPSLDDSSSGPDSDSDKEWDFCELEPVAAPAPAKGYLPFQSNPAILSHVQKGLKSRCGPNGEGVKDHPLILTVDVFPGFVDKTASTHREKMHAIKVSKDHKASSSLQRRLKDYIVGAEAEQWFEMHAINKDHKKAEAEQQWPPLTPEETETIDSIIAGVQRLIESCQITIFKATSPSATKDPNKTDDEDLTMVNIQELEEGLAKIKVRHGVEFHWGLQNPLHGYSSEPEGVFTRFLYETMVPKSRVEELRGLNQGECECGCC